jgi:hypothetical protein
MATALVFAGNTAAQADETAPTPSAGGSAIAPENSQVTVDGSRPGRTVVNVGGGTWNYGSSYAVWPPKTCWSNYKHNSKYHSSAAIMASNNSTRYANAGYWSEAKVTSGAAYTCYTYWNTY